jgi:hypothetical protein
VYTETVFSLLYPAWKGGQYGLSTSIKKLQKLKLLERYSIYGLVTSIKKVQKLKYLHSICGW